MVRAQLPSGEIGGALNYFPPASLGDNEFIFNSLTSNRLNEIAVSMRPIEYVYAKENVAKYKIKREEVADGITYDITYYIYFMIDGKSIWKIKRF
ncbi:MAG: hypothetical protein QNJ58_28070 [Desulfobacterales bacterium]|nr:hypothetical protein [Desulfobacterales bacterium]